MNIMDCTRIIGNLTKDPETKQLAGGKTVCNFTVAVNKGSGENRKTKYYRVAAWNKLAETCGKYLSKGKKVVVEGEVDVSTYITKEGQSAGNLELMADAVGFLSTQNEGRGSASAAEAPAYTAASSEDVPF